MDKQLADVAREGLLIYFYGQGRTFCWHGGGREFSFEIYVALRLTPHQLAEANTTCRRFTGQNVTQL